jgi:hypothetical protein
MTMSVNAPGPSQWISVSGSGNNIAAGAGSHAGNTVAGARQDADVRDLLAQIRDLAAKAGDPAAGAHVQAAASAIESDLAKPPEHRFSLAGAVSALRAVSASMPGLADLIDALTRAAH